MSRPRLLDLFCGGGGAGYGYHLAGFDVVGVDVDDQPDYPFEFHKADALTFPIDGFDAVHASPPCQAYVGWQNIAALRGSVNEHPRLIEPIRERLIASGLPYVIENGPNAPLITGIVLCGTSFGLEVQRHRKFESNVLLFGLPCAHTGNEIGVYGARPDGRRLFTRSDGSELRAAKSTKDASAAMGIDWMGWDTLKEAIPPAFTLHIGAQLITYLERSEAA